MSRLKLVLLSLFMLGFGGVAMAQTPLPTTSQVTDDDWRAFMAASKADNKAADDIQDQISNSIMGGKPDKKVLCDLWTKHAAAQLKVADDEQAFLDARKANGQSVAPMIGSVLKTSTLADKEVIDSIEHCAEAQTEDDTAQSVFEANALINAATDARRAYENAKHDSLTALRNLQSEGAYFDDLISRLETLRDYGSHYTPQAKEFLARLPDYKQQNTMVQADIKMHIKPYTDPKGEDDAPYVYAPTVIPPVPDNDEDFQRTFTGLIFSALQPQLHAVASMIQGDAANGCQLAKYSDAEYVKLHDFAQAYIDKQTAAGKSTEAGQKALAKLKETMDKTAGLSQQVCDSAKAVADQTAEVQAISQNMRDIQPQYIAAAQATQNSAIMHDAAGTCKNSGQLLGLMDQIIKDISRLIELMDGKLLTNPQKEQLDSAKANLSAMKTQRQQVVALNKASCPARKK